MNSFGSFSFHGVISGVSHQETSIFGEFVLMPSNQVVGQLHENTLGILSLQEFSKEGNVITFIARSFRSGLSLFFNDVSLKPDGTWSGNFTSVREVNGKSHIHGAITGTVTPMPDQVASALRIKYSNNKAMVA